MDILEELKARDERIERLERVLLFLMCSKVDTDYLQKSPDRMLKGILSPHTEGRVGKLLNEYESENKILDEFLSICEDRLSSNDR